MLLWLVTALRASTSRRKTRRNSEIFSTVQQVRVVLRVLSLLQLARGMTAPDISQVVPLTPQAIRKVAHRYREGSLERALYERERPGAATVLENTQKLRIIAMV